MKNFEVNFHGLEELDLTELYRIEGGGWDSFWGAIANAFVTIIGAVLIVVGAVATVAPALGVGIIVGGSAMIKMGIEGNFT